MPRPPTRPTDLPIADVRDGGYEAIQRLVYVFSAFAQSRVHRLTAEFHAAVVEADLGNPRSLQRAKALLRRIYSELHGPLVKSRAEAAIRECEEALRRAQEAKEVYEVENAHLTLMEHATRLGFLGQFQPSGEGQTPIELLEHSLSLDE